MKKRLISIFLSVCFILSITATVCAAPVSYRIWIDGIRITSANADNVKGDGTVSYDATLKTLILKDAMLGGSKITDVSGTVFSACIYSYDDISIYSEGTNMLVENSYADGTDFSAGICSYGRITFTGNGFISISSASHDTQNTYGIYSADTTASGGIDISSCNLTVTADSAGNSAYGIYAVGGVLKISGNADVTAISGVATNESSSVRAKDIEILNSNLITSAFAGKYTNAIYSENDINIVNSTVSALAGKGSNSQAVTAKKIIVQTSELSANGTTYAIKASESLDTKGGDISGSSVNITDGKAVTLRCNNGDDVVIMSQHKHVFTESGWQITNERHWLICDECGFMDENAAHTYMWIIDQNPTMLSTGKKHEVCDVCGKLGQTEIIPMVTDRFNTGETTPPEDTEPPISENDSFFDDITYDFQTDGNDIPEDNTDYYLDSTIPYDNDSVDISSEPLSSESSQESSNDNDETNMTPISPSESSDPTGSVSSPELTTADNTTTSPDTDKQEDDGNSLTWLWILIPVILLAAGGGVFFILKKKQMIK